MTLYKADIPAAYGGRLSYELSANSILSATVYRSGDSFKFLEDTP